MSYAQCKQSFVSIKYFLYAFLILFFKLLFIYLFSFLVSTICLNTKPSQSNIQKHISAIILTSDRNHMKAILLYLSWRNSFFYSLVQYTNSAFHNEVLLCRQCHDMTVATDHTRFGFKLDHVTQSENPASVRWQKSKTNFPPAKKYEKVPLMRTTWVREKKKEDKNQEFGKKKKEFLCYTGTNYV